MVTPAWRQYQEAAAAHFRSVGLEAQTDVKLEGARALHAIDVAVHLRQAGHQALWVVECKDWARPIPKERVLVLAEVVKDLGADRGVLLSESGFQKGALRAAANTNLELTSLSGLRARSEMERAQSHAAVLLNALRTPVVSARFELLPAPAHPKLPAAFGGVLPSLESRVARTCAGLEAALGERFPACVDVDEHEEPVLVNSLPEAVQAAVVVLKWARAQNDQLMDLIQD